MLFRSRQYIRYPQEPLPDWTELARRDKALTRELEELLRNNGTLLREILLSEEA